MKDRKICVDFDGTICGGSIISPDGLKDGVIEVLSELRKKGYRIVIHSCRVNPCIDSKYVGDMAYFLNSHKVPYDEIWYGYGKPIADFYIDDKAIRFSGSWDDVMDTIKEVE